VLRFAKAITALRTAVEKGDGTVGKEANPHSDVMHAFRLSVQFRDGMIRLIS